MNRGSASSDADSGSEAGASSIRVMLVDDSAVIRGLIARWLEAERNIEITVTASNGLMALNALQRTPVDLIVLDIDMPEMDGLTALPKLLEIRPDVQILMASTLTQRNADISLRALAMGAVDYVPKPLTTGAIANGEEFRRLLVEKVRAIGEALLRRRSTGGAPRPERAPAKPERSAGAASRRFHELGSAHTAPQVSKSRPEVLVIGSSTGGPQALFDLLPEITAGCSLPIVVAQHMPPTFTKSFAEHLARRTGRFCQEARNGDMLRQERVYVAPGDYHLVLTGQAHAAEIRLNQDPPENFCRPAVDPLFRSAAEVFGSSALALVLTGMGHDGARGARSIVNRGGTVFAQDEESSVVWGMPGAVVKAGLAAKVLRLNQIGAAVLDLTHSEAIRESA